MSNDKKLNEVMYGDYTIEEVMAIESMHYYIQIGTEMLETETGKTSFKKERAENLFKNAMDSLRYLRSNGTEVEKEEALECLLNFKIHKLRIH